MTSLEIMVFNRYALMNFRTRRCFILLLLMWVFMESSFEAIRREWSKKKKIKLIRLNNTKKTCKVKACIKETKGQWGHHW